MQIVHIVLANRSNWKFAFRRNEMLGFRKQTTKHHNKSVFLRMLTQTTKNVRLPKPKRKNLKFACCLNEMLIFLTSACLFDGPAKYSLRTLNVQEPTLRDPGYNNRSELRATAAAEQTAASEEIRTI